MAQQPVNAGGGVICCYCDNESGVLFWTLDGRLAHRACVVRAQRRALADKHRLADSARKSPKTTTGGSYA